MSVRPALLLALTLPTFSPAAPAQCTRWAPGFDLQGGGGPVLALEAHDDGSGPALYVGGFGQIARFDGAAWSTLGSVGGSVYSLAVYDDGAGPALYAAGSFVEIDGVAATCIARWDGTSWTALGAGLGSTAFDLEVFDDGTGPALYACGGFSTAGGVPAGGIARWDGAAWSALPGAPGETKHALAAFDDGTGPALYVGGHFSTSSGSFANRVARWDGASWSAVGAGTSGAVFGLEVFDDGSGPSLYAAGAFATAGGVPAQGVARWDGASWSGTGLTSTDVGDGFELLAHDDGSGPVLIAAGRAPGAASETRILRLAGGAWSALGTTDHLAGALASVDLGTGPELVVGGHFDSIDGVDLGSIARWSAGAWEPLSSGLGLDGAVRALAVHDDGNGPALYAGGAFREAGSTLASRVARFEGGGWSPLAGGVSGPDPAPVEVRAFQTFDDGSGPALYVGGLFAQAGGVAASNVARWSGGVWSAVGGGTNGRVTSFAVYDDGSGPALYAGGAFTAAGGTVAPYVARWDGSSWSTVGTTEGFDHAVLALGVFDDGSGLRLYAGGAFANVDGLAARGIARWDGLAWSAVGGDLSVGSSVHALAVFDDGGGPALYAGGNELVGLHDLARWDGAGWSSIEDTLPIQALAVFDDGSGPALYTGEFSRVRRWNAAGWTTVGDTNEQVRALAVGAEGTALYVGGEFSAVAGLPSRHLARWERCATAPVAFCFGDGTGAPCPCGNDGLPGHGCRNSATIRGAELTASGTNVPDTLVLRSEFEPATALSIFLQGDAELANPAVFGDGLRCVGGALKRLYVTNAAAGIASAPTPSDPSITERSAELGDPIAPGSTRGYQVYYRDPEPTWCPPPAGSTFNASNGLRVVW